MDLLGVTEMSVEWTCKVSAGEVKLRGMTPETPSMALSISDIALSDFYDYYLLPIGPRTC